jgi:rhomboid protease GluP
MSQEPLSVSSPRNIHIQKNISQILSEISNRYGLDLRDDPVALERIEEAVENAWTQLTTRSSVEVTLPFISANAGGPIHLQKTLTRADFGIDPIDSATEDMSQQTDIPEESTARQAKIELPDRKSMVTMTIMVITVLMYAFQLLSNVIYGYDLPAALGKKSNELIISGQYWRLITPVLLHGSILHLGFNMYALYILGRRVEQFFGSLRFLALYIIAGITGNVFSFFFTAAPSLGSSTAVFGLLAAEGIFIYQHRELFGEQFKIALRQIIQVAVINIIIGLSPGIDNWGHIGGLIGGVIFSWFGGPIFKVKAVPSGLKLEDVSARINYLLTIGLMFLALTGLVIGIIILKV